MERKHCCKLFYMNIKKVGDNLGTFAFFAIKTIDRKFKYQFIAQRVMKSLLLRCCFSGVEELLDNFLCLNSIACKQTQITSWTQITLTPLRYQSSNILKYLIECPNECFLDPRINKPFILNQDFLICKANQLPRTSPQQRVF